MKKKTHIQRILAYKRKHPNAKAAEIAVALNIGVQQVYQNMYLYRKKQDGQYRNFFKTLPPYVEVKQPDAEPAPEPKSITALLRERLASANAVQVGGDHYKTKAIQPWDYISANKLGYFEGNIVKYVSRWREKGGVADLEKAAHYLQKLIEQERA
jgi:hypothetical protein